MSSPLFPPAQPKTPQTSPAPVPLAQPRAARLRWHPRTRRGWAGLLLVIVAVLVLIAWLMARATPSWYQPLNPTDTRVLDSADRGQFNLASELHNAWERTPLGPQRWTVTQDEVNSLLSVGFDAPGAAAHDRAHPPVVSAPFVLFEPGKILLSARTTKVPGDRPGGGVASAIFAIDTTPSASGAAQARVRLVSAAIGNLPVPRWLVARKLQSMAPGLVAVAERAAIARLGATGNGHSPRGDDLTEIDTALRSALQGTPFPTRFRYHGRDIVVQDVRVAAGSLSIVFAPLNPTAGKTPITR